LHCERLFRHCCWSPHAAAHASHKMG
jgi:hypothetical protein